MTKVQANRAKLRRFHRKVRLLMHPVFSNQAPCMVMQGAENSYIWNEVE